MLGARESRRIDLALARGGFLLSILVFVLPVVMFTGRMRPLTPSGVILYGGSFMPSYCLLLFLAIRLPGDAVGDGRSGLLELLGLTNLPSTAWLAYRQIQIWIGFLSVWIIRIPIVWLAFVLGGVAIDDLVTRELLLLGAFAILSTFAMFLSHGADSRRQVNQRLFGTVFALETVLILPRLVLDALTTYLSIQFPNWVAETADHFASMRFSPNFQAAITNSFSWSMGWTSVLLYSTIAIVMLGWMVLALYRPPADQPANVTSGLLRKSPQQRRDSRRSWDDALAWQAYALHSNGKQIIQCKIALYAFVALAMPVCFQLDYRELWLTLSLLLCGGSILAAVNKTGDCLQRELKDQTLSALLLTPNDAVDIYDGWRRAGWHLSWPDLIAAPLLVSVLAANFPDAVPVVVAILIGILLSGPFMMLSPLVPFTVKGLFSGLMLVGIPVVLIGVGISFGIAVNPWLSIPVAIPLWALYNQWLRRRTLKKWMDEKVSTLT